jgi:hypothetical protein
LIRFSLSPIFMYCCCGIKISSYMCRCHPLSGFHLFSLLINWNTDWFSFYKRDRASVWTGDRQILNALYMASLRKSWHL